MSFITDILKSYALSRLSPSQRKQAREIELYAKAARAARWYHKEGAPWPMAISKAIQKYPVDRDGLGRYLDVDESKYGV